MTKKLATYKDFIEKSNGEVKRVKVKLLAAEKRCELLQLEIEDSKRAQVSAIRHSQRLEVEQSRDSLTERMELLEDWSQQIDSAVLDASSQFVTLHTLDGKATRIHITTIEDTAIQDLDNSMLELEQASPSRFQIMTDSFH